MLHSTLTARVAGLLLVLATVWVSQPLSAQRASSDTPPRTIQVTGTGEVEVQPDRAQIDLAVESFAATARAAGEENARDMERVIRALTAAGVARSDIETRNYTIFPEYAPPPDGTNAPPRIRGYRANNTVSIRTSDLTRIGGLIDTALGAGANRVDMVRFSVADTDAAQAEATRRAVARARQSAETIAAALGVQLGPVLDASTSLEPIRPFPVTLARGRPELMDSAAPPIQPADQTVAASVTVVYRIETPR